MATGLLELQQMLQSRGILISFSGRLNQRLIVEYGEAVKSYLETENRPQNEVFNIFSLFIEQTQNINNYCAANQEHSHIESIAHSSIVIIGKMDEGSYVCSGNLIDNRDAEKLRAYIEPLCGMDKSDLKALYKTKLKEGVITESSGAGLGLIDMARKSKQALEYSIVKQDDTLSFFTLKAIV
ncbi:SiaB family protein kinase [Paenibacillus koleovorans]|uniref:SiaB family protein kinase n=1 Tax=Paenibacillus koleovorans TaxID=121608 RepID=UPI000FD835B5|nr:SiaB family protein kinase [Paenibacillus koleovorans]